MSKEPLNIDYSVTKAKDNAGYYCENVNFYKTFVDRYSGQVCPQFHYTIEDDEDPVETAKTLLSQRYAEIDDQFITSNWDICFE
mgnify:CR=1 FL=1|jgi:hypothetical protein|tara:strand:+ start:8026 stop:8277 length:252 start_codon:yes stop_codon:yes gene_type:complete